MDMYINDLGERLGASDLVVFIIQFIQGVLI